MELKDEWLEQLCEFADEPIFTLARRYYLQESYSASDFIRFYNDYLVKMNDVSLHLLDIYKNAKKRRLLLELCLNDSNFNEKEIVNWYAVADQVKTIEDSKKIEYVFHQYSDIGVVLLEISNNRFTPKEILYKLSTIKGISYAGTIRKNSKDTLKLKMDCGENK